MSLLLLVMIISDLYWRLNKALYGLNQSSRQWNILFTDFLKNYNFIQLISDPCIFKNMEGGIITWIIAVYVYVDDLLITGLNKFVFDIIRKIKNTFKISKCSNANYILGIKIERNGSISQS